MSREIRNRIIRPATPEELERHKQIREATERELPELQQWAREVAARQKDRVSVGTVLTASEVKVAEAMDDYAAAHGLQNRGSVVREALSQLLGIEIARQ